MSLLIGGGGNGGGSLMLTVVGVVFVIERQRVIGGKHPIRRRRALRMALGSPNIANYAKHI